jgi:hypothetical protein
VKARRAIGVDCLKTDGPATRAERAMVFMMELIDGVDAIDAGGDSGDGKFVVERWRKKRVRRKFELRELHGVILFTGVSER